MMLVNIAKILVNMTLPDDQYTHYIHYIYIYIYHYIIYIYILIYHYIIYTYIIYYIVYTLIYHDFGHTLLVC